MPIKQKTAREKDNGGNKLSKSFRISWHALIEEDSILEGRSLVKAESDQAAAHKLIYEKATEYRLRQQWVMIDSLIELVNE